MGRAAGPPATLLAPSLHLPLGGSPEPPSQQPGGEEDLEVMKDGGLACPAQRGAV